MQTRFQIVKRDRSGGSRYYVVRVDRNNGQTFARMIPGEWLDLWQAVRVRQCYEARELRRCD